MAADLTTRDVVQFVHDTYGSGVYAYDGGSGTVLLFGDVDRSVVASLEEQFGALDWELCEQWLDKQPHIIIRLAQIDDSGATQRRETDPSLGMVAAAYGAVPPPVDNSDELAQLSERAEDADRYRQLLWGVVHNARGPTGTPWLARVCKATGCGSTVAKELCREFGVDPDRTE